MLRLLGTFEGETVRELLRHIHAEAERDIVVDVSLVRGFDEVGIAALARLAEATEGHRIAIRGLSTHQLRILRYLGSALSSVASAPDR